MNDNQVHPESIQPASTDHDDWCERIDVDIGVGTQSSPCGCRDRQQATEIERLRAEVAELNQCNRLAVDEIAILEADLAALKRQLAEARSGHEQLEALFEIEKQTHEFDLRQLVEAQDTLAKVYTELALTRSA